MFPELHDDEILVRAFFRPRGTDKDIEQVLWPTDFERRRKPTRKRDENGISLTRLIGHSGSVGQLPDNFKATLSKSSSHVGFAAASVKDLHAAGCNIVADGDFHVSLFCELCNMIALPAICTPPKANCTLQPETDLSFRQRLSNVFKVQPSLVLHT